MGANNIRPGMGGGARPPAHSPPAGTASGIPGASYPVMGSSPVTNMQPRLGNPGQAQIRPPMSPGMPQGGPLGMPSQPGMQGPPPAMSPQGMQGTNPQQLATALGQMGGAR